MLAESDAGHGRSGFFEWTAVGMAGLEIERIELAGSAVHPQQDARAGRSAFEACFGRQRLEPARHRPTDHAERSQPKRIAPRQAVLNARTRRWKLTRSSWQFPLPLNRRRRERGSTIKSMIKHELAAVEQHPKDIDKRRFAILLGAGASFGEN